MENNNVINTKITKNNIVLEIPKDWVINDFNEMVEGFKVKGNRKNKFLDEVLFNLVEIIIDEDILQRIYDDLVDSENVMELEEDY